MAESTSARQVQSEGPCTKTEDLVGEAVHVFVEERNGKPISVVARLRTLVHHPKMSLKIEHFTFSDAVKWVRQGRPAWRGFLIAAVLIAAFAALTGLVAFALIFISSSLNVAFASFLVAVSTIGFIWAFFFSSITVVYMGALGFGGLTIGSIAFFSVWAVIILSGWAGIAWVIWQGLRKAFQIGRYLILLAGSFLLSFPAVQELGAKFKEYVAQVQACTGSLKLHLGAKFKEHILLKQKKTAMD
ncbi:hypothetical protein M758_7G050100 [Ceratodon purpureus]|nr:hypothetical protein M758_7G050100 [Ceratodon purpureus]